MKKVSKKVTGMMGALILSTSLALPVYANQETQPGTILFSGGLHTQSIYQFNPETLQTKRITSGNSVDVSPSGDMITYIKHDSVYVADSSGKNAVRLTRSRFPHFDSSPRFSPDGEKIVFARSDGNLYTIELENKKVTQLTKAEDGVFHSSPDWSPDGKKIVFHSTDKDGNTGLFIMNADGSQISPLTGHNDPKSSEYSPHFSPDGKSVLFEKSQNGQTDIYVMNLATKQARNITADLDKAASGAVWSEDGKQILFTINEENEKEKDSSSFYIMNKDGSNKKMLQMQVKYATPSEWKTLNVSEQEEGFLKKVKNFLLD
jgi:TolB protein